MRETLEHIQYTAVYRDQKGLPGDMWPLLSFVSKNFGCTTTPCITKSSLNDTTVSVSSFSNGTISNFPWDGIKTQLVELGEGGLHSPKLPILH